jgi:hypothetical protein
MFLLFIGFICLCALVGLMFGGSTGGAACALYGALSVGAVGFIGFVLLLLYVMSTSH